MRPRADEAPDPRGPVAGGPRHVGVIMDGNGRWARARCLPRVAGHKAGVEAVRAVVRAAPGIGLDALTLYAFSSENWRRPADEVSALMGLLRAYIASELAELHARGVRLRLIGDWRRMSGDVVADLEAALERTAANTGMTLVIALNYGSHDELARAAAAAARDGEVTAAAIEARLDTAGLPPLDLVVRTSGEYRLSNFLLWQAAYAELVFTPTLWPDFGGPQLRAACEDFARRERRFGGL